MTDLTQPEFEMEKEFWKRKNADWIREKEKLEDEQRAQNSERAFQRGQEWQRRRSKEE